MTDATARRAVQLARQRHLAAMGGEEAEERLRDPLRPAPTRPAKPRTSPRRRLEADIVEVDARQAAHVEHDLAWLGRGMKFSST